MYFYNQATGEKFEPTFLMHLRYFFLNEEKNFGIVVVICAVMAVVLIFFFGYHLGLATRNETCNENYKRDEFNQTLKMQKQTLERLLKEVEEWKPDPNDKKAELPPLKIDGELMPTSKSARLKKYKEFAKNFADKERRLGVDTPYKPHPSLWAAIKYIWNEQ